VDVTAVLGFTVVAFTLIAVPGPDWAYVLAAGARDHLVIPAVVGLMTGYALLTAVVAAGVATVVTEVPLARATLTVVGAGYLTFLGLRMLRSGPAQADPKRPAPTRSPGRHLIDGIGVSLLNPKGLLIFLSVLPQFTSSSGGWPMHAQLSLLGGIFVLLVGTFYLPLGYATDRVLGRQARLARITSGVAGGSMIVTGIAVLSEYFAGL